MLLIDDLNFPEAIASIDSNILVMSMNNDRTVD